MHCTTSAHTLGVTVKSQCRDAHSLLNSHVAPFACGASHVPVVWPVGMLHHESPLQLSVHGMPRAGYDVHFPIAVSHV